MPREGLGKRLPVDPAIVRQIERSPTMLQEQGGAGVFLRDWGGSYMYQEMSKAPVEARTIYYGVVGGSISPEELQVVTGLSDKEVSKGLKWLQRKGYVSVEEIS